MKKIPFFLLLVWAAAGLGAQSRGSTMYVAVKTAELKVNPRFFADVSRRLSLGEALTVLRSGNGWVEVVSAADESVRGWVSLNALSSRRVIPTARTASAEEVAMAGKGFSAEIEEIYKSTVTADYSAVDAMEELTVSGAELYTFMSAGRLETGE